MASQPGETTERPQPTPASDSARTSRIVSDRSRVGFRVRKMGIYYVKGCFREIRGEIEFGANGLPARGDAVIEAGSITTRIPPRDWHLRSPDFLDVRRHPLITIATGGAPRVTDGGFVVQADFSIHGQRHQADLEGHLHTLGEARTLHLTGVLDRQVFRIRARQPFEMVVGRQVHLDVELGLEPAS
jgi:polyisoprenoid-binding protein YceI